MEKKKNGGRGMGWGKENDASGSGKNRTLVKMLCCRGRGLAKK